MYVALIYSWDVCSWWGFFFFRQKKTVIGRITEILQQDGDADGVPDGLVTIENFPVSEQLHPDFEMPVLQRPLDASLRLITVLANVRIF